MLADVKPASGRAWFLLGVPAMTLWCLVAYLGVIEVNYVLRGEGTEHSPLLVMGYLLAPALLLSWAAVALRRRTRRINQRR